MHTGTGVRARLEPPACSLLPAPLQLPSSRNTHRLLFASVPCPRYLIFCNMCFRPTGTVPSSTLRVHVLSSPGSGLGSASAWCPLPACPSQGRGAKAEETTEEQHAPALTALRERPSGCPKPGSPSGTLPSCLLGALAPCCPQGCACLFLGLFRTQARKGANSARELPLSGSVCSATSFRPLSCPFPTSCSPSD